MKKVWKKICDWIDNVLVVLIVLPFAVIEWLAEKVLDGRKPS